MSTYNKAFYRQSGRNQSVENLCLENKAIYSDRAPSKSRVFAKAMEFCVTFLLALLVLSLASFLTVRPVLNEVKVEAGSHWEKFVKSARDRNDLIPGLAESIKGASPGQGKLTGRLFEERSILRRSNDPKEIIASIDEMDRQLNKIGKLAESSSEINSYQPFNQTWKRVISVSADINSRRLMYNQTARRYNELMIPFPQNIFSSIFGFAPLQYYPTNIFPEDSSQS